MTDRLRIALAQLNPRVGALDYNVARGRAALADAIGAGADILLLPELFITGYFPEDLLLREGFVADAERAALELVSSTTGTAVSLLIPTPWRHGGALRNAVLLAEDGVVTAIRFKRELPNADVFYEKRYFTPGPLAEPVQIKGVTVGVPICEDIWHAETCAHLVEKGAEILLCPNGSPYWRDKQLQRRRLVAARIADDGVPLLYLNQVGGQDELVYDGASFAMQPGTSGPVLQARSFVEDLLVSDWHHTPHGWRIAPSVEVGTGLPSESASEARAGRIDPLPSAEEAPWQAAMLGLRDYVEKNGFSDVVLGLSGGIDSAVVAAIAVDALGAAHVRTVMLPYRYTSPESLRDATDAAARLGIHHDTVAIGAAVDAANADLAPIFAGRAADLTEENIQSRMRGLLLMAVSNKLGCLLLTTGNKSEMAVGYATIYGDMNGAFNPIKDMLKTEVYRLARWRNTHHPTGALGPAGEVIPLAIIDKAPSAELRPDQTDQDSLPPYEVLDGILKCLVEEELTVAETVARGFEMPLVTRIERLLYLAEYKRRQSAPGVKISEKAFGLGRKYPITNGYRDNGAKQ